MQLIKYLHSCTTESSIKNMESGIRNKRKLCTSLSNNLWWNVWSNEKILFKNIFLFSFIPSHVKFILSDVHNTEFTNESPENELISFETPPLRLKQVRITLIHNRMQILKQNSSILLCHIPECCFLEPSSICETRTQTENLQQEVICIHRSNTTLPHRSTITSIQFPGMS